MKSQYKMLSSDDEGRRRLIQTCLIVFIVVIHSHLSVTFDVNFCSDKSDGLHMDPDSCTGYYRCVDGQAFMQRCPPGLIFSGRFKRCFPYFRVPERAVECVGSLRSPTTSSMTLTQRSTVSSSTSITTPTTTAVVGSTTLTIRPKSSTSTLMNYTVTNSAPKTTTNFVTTTKSSAGTSCTHSELVKCWSKLPQLNNRSNENNVYTDFCNQTTEHNRCVDRTRCTKADQPVYQVYLVSVGSAKAFAFVCDNDTLSELVTNSQQCPLAAVIAQLESCYSDSFPGRFYDHSIDKICQYYRTVYSCMRHWLHNQPNCSRAVVFVLEAIHQFTVPFTTNYNCSITISQDDEGTTTTLSISATTTTTKIDATSTPSSSSSLSVNETTTTTTTTTTTPANFSSDCTEITLNHCESMAPSTSVVVNNMIFTSTQVDNFCRNASLYGTCVNTIDCSGVKMKNRIVRLIILRHYNARRHAKLYPQVCSNNVRKEFFGGSLLCAKPIIDKALNSCYNSSFKTAINGTRVNDICKYYNLMYRCMYDLVTPRCGSKAALLHVNYRIKLWEPAVTAFYCDIPTDLSSSSLSRRRRSLSRYLRRRDGDQVFITD